MNVARPLTEEQRQRARDRARRWRLDNPERAAANARRSDKAWRARNPERARELSKLSQRRRKDADPEAARARSREYYLKNREQQIEKTLKWYRENPERGRVLKREASRRKKRANPAAESDRFRRMKMARLHGMKPDEWAALWDEQAGRCYLCGDDLASLTARNVHVDHDHRCCSKETSCSYCRRGLACFRCNAAIGMAFDDPERLRRMAANLERALAAATKRLAGKPEQLALNLPA